MKSKLLGRIALIAFCITIFIPIYAGSALADMVVSAVRRADTLANMEELPKSIIDGKNAIKNGRKMFYSADIAQDSIQIGKAMLGKLADSVDDDVIEVCAKFVKSGRQSLDDVGAIIGEIFKRQKLAARERALLLNDAYLRIAQKAGRITAEDADDAFRLLKDSEGLHALVRKCCTKNVNQAAGHLYEFQQAVAFARKGFKVVGVGLKYFDGIKSAKTDLDLLVKKGNRIFLIESKHYTFGTGIPDVIRADADSLIKLKDCLGRELGGSASITPLFTFVVEPRPLLAKQLQMKGIPYFVGESEDVVAALSATY